MNYLITILSLLVITACSSDGNPEPEDPGTGQTVNVEKTVTINAGQTYQTLAGFGASDCWMPAYVGKYWTSGRAGIGELLFSSEIQSGQPKGIGLSLWRTNLGAGTLEQGDASGIDDKSRRAESYMPDGATPDWTRCQGQRYFLDCAKTYGCESVVLFSNSPLVQYTSNGKGYSASGGVSNLKSDCYDDYAAYMADVAQYYISQGYPVTHISPVNEPQYNWEGGQEGSGWTNAEVARLARELDAALTTRGLSTGILLGEAGDWTYLYSTSGDANRSNVISSFFTPGSAAYVGDLEHVGNLVCGHSYWTDGAWSTMRNVRERVAQASAQYGVDIWQSEWSMLGDGYSASEFAGFSLASEMDIALYMSKVIHNDLTVAGVSSWSFWTAMDMPRWDHKNRFLLVSLTPAAGIYGDVEAEGSFQATPTLWVLGNYSLFIRPGYRRIAMGLGESHSFFGSAWISPQGDKIVAVYSNLSDKGVRLDETRENWAGTPKSITTYTTTGSKNLKESTLADDQQIVLEAGSVTTIVYNL